MERTLSDTVETSRLLGERTRPEHAPELEPLLCDPRVGATLGGVMTPEQVAAQTAALAEEWARHGFGWMVWREKASGAVVARGGLRRTSIAGRDEVEVGWAVTADRWGEGFAPELGGVCVRLGFEVLALDDIVSFTLPDNAASRRVMEKLGLRYERDITHAGMPHVLYRISRGP